MSRTRKNRSLRVGAAWLALHASVAWCQGQTEVTPAVPSPVSDTPSRPSSEANLSAQNARDWGLTREEWTRYRQLMRGPLGIYSPNLDPLTALGTEARSEAERTHIAEAQARMEAQRVTKLLAYQRAYDAAWKRLYPSLTPVQPHSQNTSNSVRAGGGSASARLAVFVKEDCPLCDQRVRDLEASGHPFDLYMVGTRGDDARIRAWAMRLRIDPAKVRAGSITLNHDAGRWLSLGLPGALPAVLHSVEGQWTRG